MSLTMGFAAAATDGIMARARKSHRALSGDGEVIGFSIVQKTAFSFL